MPVELQGCWEIPCMEYSSLLLEPRLQCLYLWLEINRKKFLIKPLLSKALDFFLLLTLPKFCCLLFSMLPSCSSRIRHMLPLTFWKLVNILSSPCVIVHNCVWSLFSHSECWPHLNVWHSWQIFYKVITTIIKLRKKKNPKGQKEKPSVEN